MLGPFIVSGYINALTAFLLGLFAYVRNRKSEKHVVFGMMSLTISLWSLSYALWLSAGIAYEALFWVKSLAFFATFIPVFYYHWVLSLLNKEKQRKTLLTLSYFLTFFLAFLVFSPYYVNAVEEKLFFPFWPNGTYLYFIYIVVLFVGVASLGMVELIINYKKSNKAQKNQIKYIVIGSFIGFLGGFTNFFLWFDVEILPLGNFLVFLYVIIFSYAMLKHRLMDIRFLVVRSVMYFLLLAIFGAFYVIAIFVIGGLVFGQFTGREAYWASMLIALMVGFTFYPLKDKFTKLTDKIFFKDRYDFQELTDHLNETATSTIVLPELLFKFLNLLIDEMKITRGAFVLLEKKKIFEVQSLGYKKTFELSPKEIKHLAKEKKMEVLEEVKEGSVCRQILLDKDASIIIPLVVENQLIGLLFLGGKKSGDSFTDQDIDVIKIVSKQLSLGIQNAKAYEKTQKFNLILRAEVNRATKQLRTANEKLQELDQAKDEFISMASHEIRTPIATLEGYLSILNNPKLPKKDRRTVMQRAYEGVGRLATMAKDLLDVSRIDQERLKINKELTRLETIITRCVEGFELQVKDRKIFLKFRKPPKALPEIAIDPDRITEVFNNLIGNAIKFTHKGGITISTEKKDDVIQVSVTDTGEGIPKDSVDHLFEKFYQATTASSILGKDKGGTGLGLYITKHIVEIHGGKIWVESVFKKGTTFHFALPIKKK